MILSNNMEWLKNNLKNNYHFIFAFGIAGIIFAATSFSNPPLFQNTDNFVLFAQEEIKLEQGIQISSGDLGSNKEIDIQKEAIISGNLFADKITLDKNTVVNGNISFNKLKTEKETQILGSKTTPVKLPIANLPEIPEFSVGTQDFKFEGRNNTLVAGNYRDIALAKDSRLTLTGGIYNLRKLELKENSTLIFNSSVTLNIQFKLKGQERVSILPGQNFKPTDLVINYLGIRAKQEKDQREDDDDEINSLHDDKEKKDYKEQKIGRPIVFGEESFLNFKLLAPKASVKLGETSTMRGQILARRVKVEKESVLSREEFFSKDTNLDKVTIVEGEKFPVNEIIIVMRDGATFADAQAVANLISGRIIGFIPKPQIYKIEVPAQTPAELEVLINTIHVQQNPLILFVVQNLAGGLKK